MNVFDIDADLIGRYERFARSFTTIRAEDIKNQVDAIYDSNKFWPEPLIGINPAFLDGKALAELAADKSVDPDLPSVFATGEPRRPIGLYRHQEQSLAKALQGRNYIVTTGTGSGKSLCFFVPVIDRILKARRAGEARRTRAIVIYPMNALANSQREELEKFIETCGLPGNMKPTFARYTGQERDTERQAVADNPPDILLTNFMMLELLLTRQDDLDCKVIENMAGLEFLVLDELHTYRGRQGADVAMLVRRVRERVGSKTMLCIGTSATMASGDEDAGRKSVADVGTLLFGSEVKPDDVITESLRRCTEGLPGEAALKAAILQPEPMPTSTEAFRSDPLASWIEMNIGLEGGEVLKRRRPMTLTDAASELAAQTGVGVARCRAALAERLVAMSSFIDEQGRAFMAFKLHRFLAGAGHAHATLQRAGTRRVTLAAEKFDREDKEARLYPVFFCRACGQEVHSVSINPEGRLIARPIDLTPRDDIDEDGAEHGFLVPDADGNLSFAGDIEDYPDDWIEQTLTGTSRLKSSHRGKHDGRLMMLGADGWHDENGLRCWFFPGKYRFCPQCKDQPPPGARDINKLAGLSAEGRSSATTLITATALDWMEKAKVPEQAHRRKLLGFTDNRQDAALQAGHFNDFIFVTLLRGAMLRAVRKAGEDGLEHEQFGSALRKALGFEPENDDRRHHWMLDPEPLGFQALDKAKKAVGRVLAHRLWNDLRRGWRYTNPNLDQLDLIRVDYPGIPALANDAKTCSGVEQAGLDDNQRRGFGLLEQVLPEAREDMFRELFEFMRQGLAIAVDALDQNEVLETAEQSRQVLKDPWAIGREEEPSLQFQTALVIGAEGGKKDRIVRVSGRSKLARSLAKRFDYLALPDRELLIEAMLLAAQRHQMVRQFSAGSVVGWRLAPSALVLRPGKGEPAKSQDNAFFRELYQDVAARLATPGGLPMAFEAREHTAQVESLVREMRECRFRYGGHDKQRMAEIVQSQKVGGEKSDFLPLLYCSPTMELGVDISQLNVVYLRNAPPTPANYAQRAGRAGRSGQAALIVTYCAAQSPHDQYYFERRTDLVAGIVRAPAIDLLNPDLLETHVHAEWLAAMKEKLGKAIPENLDMTKLELPIADKLITAATAATADQAGLDRAARVIASALPSEGNAEIGDPSDFAALRWNGAAKSFNAAFERWRTLYKSAHEERKAASALANQPGLSAQERKDARQRYVAADRQVELLEMGTSSASSDFYAYRYLATEGFLPGYNFPRLPLYAFIDGEKSSTVLQRPRFLAIAEFGPNSLVYHEGKAYRCNRAKLPAGTRNADNSLATQKMRCCHNCGAAHAIETQERCVVCNAGLNEDSVLSKLYRIENVDAVPGARITANDEDRQRRGFELRTIFQWNPDKQERLLLKADDSPLGVVRYGPQTRLSRVNLGLRRRAHKEHTGFDIDTVSGRWLKNEAAGDEEGETSVTGMRRQTIVPLVEDTKNALLLHLDASFELNNEQMATLQHALVRAIETEHVLETGELLGEPLPTRENRRAILLYEASEGGAGVLKRLMDGPQRWRRLAEVALEMMHYKREDGELVDNDEPCVAGCYRCLLSYFNQPDHEIIDRTDCKVLAVLDCMSRCEKDWPAAAASGAGQVDLDPWEVALAKWEAPAPSSETLEGVHYRLCWPGLMVMAVIGAAPDALKVRCESMGRILIELPDSPGDAIPAVLADALGVA